MKFEIGDHLRVGNDTGILKRISHNEDGTISELHIALDSVVWLHVKPHEAECREHKTAYSMKTDYLDSSGILRCKRCDCILGAL